MKCERCLEKADMLTEVEIVKDGEVKIINICNECLDERV